MEEIEYDNIGIDIIETNKHVLELCSRILTQYQDVLNKREKDICKHLLEGRSRKWVADTFQMTSERVRQIFYKCIIKLSDAYREELNKTEKLVKENEKLKHRLFVLEQEMLSSKTRKDTETLSSKEQALCVNALKLLDVPVCFLPLSSRAINVLEAAEVQTFKDIPMLPVGLLYSIKRCGRKTIYDINNYLSKFNLKFGMTYDNILSSMAGLSNEDISLDNYGDYRAKKEPIVLCQIKPTKEPIDQLTLRQFCGEMGTGKKKKKKWGGIIERILLDNQIDTLEKFLAMKPCEFEALKGVGPAALKYAKMAFDHFGIEWSDDSYESHDINITVTD
jgi:hypothetical protein